MRFSPSVWNYQHNGVENKVQFSNCPTKICALNKIKIQHGECIQQKRLHFCAALLYIHKSDKKRLKYISALHYFTSVLPNNWLYAPSMWRNLTEWDICRERRMEGHSFSLLIQIVWHHANLGPHFQFYLANPAWLWDSWGTYLKKGTKNCIVLSITLKIWKVCTLRQVEWSVNLGGAQQLSGVKLHLKKELAAFWLCGYGRN